MPVSDPTLDKPSALSPKKIDLPPAGDEQRETLLKRLDTLQAEAEKIASQLGIERATPLRADHDAQVAAKKLALPIDPNAEVGIRGLRDDRQYVCVWRDPFNRLANRVFFSYRKEGWKPVQAGDPEWDANPESQSSSNTLNYADCLLMWMPKAQYVELERKRIALRIAREEGVPQQLLEMADRAGVKATYGALPTEGGPQSVAAQAMAAAESRRPGTNALAMDIAKRKFADALRAGTLTR